MKIKVGFIFLLMFCLQACTMSKMAVKPSVEHTKQTTSSKKPRNIIFLIGDGMGLTQITAGMYMNHNRLELERMPVIGIHKSYSIDDLITDSAAGATAFSIGRKTKNGYIGVDSFGKRYTTILEECAKNNMATGMVVTSTIVHATPAAFLAHQSGREDYEAIAMDFYNGNCDLLIGGGKKYFDRRVKDSINLVEKLIEKGFTVSDYFQEDFENIQIPNVNKYLFFTADGDPLPASQGRNYLAKASKDAIQFLNSKNKGFFLMIEGSQIDWGGHANESDYIISEVLDFNKAIKEALDFAEKDQNTLVVITADHETGGYVINPGSKFGALTTTFSTKKHSAAMIPVFAYGPGAENFSGIYENTEIYYRIKKLLLD